MKNDTKQPKSLLEWFYNIVHANPESILRATDDTTISYATLNEQTSLLAAWMQTRGRLSRSARVAILIPNHIDYAVALFATWKIGGCVVDVDLNLSAKEIAAHCLGSKVDAVIVSSDYLRSELLVEHRLMLVAKPRFFSRPWWRWVINSGSYKGATSLKQAILEGRGMPYVRPMLHSIEAASIQHIPKRIRLTHQAVIETLQSKKIPESYSKTLGHFLQQFFE